MLAYAADTPRTAALNQSPKALALIIAGHALVLAVVMTARPEIAAQIVDRTPTIFDVPVDPPPPPPPQPTVDRRPHEPVTQPSFIGQERPIIDMEQQTPIQLATGPSIADIGAVIGSGPITIIDSPKHVPVKLGPRLATPESALKPPYPLDMRRAGQEATLRLKLTIDTRGRVTTVEPVGPANASFLDAARRHILKAWRYQPATEDGAAVQSTTVISFSFRLEDV